MDDTFITILEEIVGLTPAQIQLLTEQSINDPETLALLDEDAMTDLFSKRPLSAATIITKMKLKALRLWIQEKDDTDAEYNLDDFTDAKCTAMLKKMSRKSGTTSLKDSSKKSDAKAPEKFNGKHKNWKQWKAEFEAYLSAIRGVNDVPLIYIIRDDDNMTQEEKDNLEGPAKEVYDAPLQGTFFDRDNYQVFQYLRAQIVGGSAETHLEPFVTDGDGRNAWIFLKAKYEGEDARNAAIAVARKEISNATWERNSKNWTLDDYCMKHTRANNTLTKYGVPVDGPSQVRAFLDGILNHQMDGVKSLVMFHDDSKNDLGKAIIKFKDTVSALNLVKSGRHDHEDHRRIGSASRGGRYQSQGRGGQRDGKNNKRPYEYNSNRGGRGGHSRHQGRGRYTPHPGRSQPELPDDGLKLDKNILDQMNSKQRAAFYKGRDAMRSNNETQNNRNIGSAQSQLANQMHDEISAVTEAITNSHMTAASSMFGKEGNRSLNNGVNNNPNRKQGAVESGQRFISSTKTSKTSVIEYDFNKRARAEIDSRADTVCAGSTFRLLEESNHYCVVSGFHKDMSPLQNIPVATVATAYDDPVSQQTFTS